MNSRLDEILATWAHAAGFTVERFFAAGGREVRRVHLVDGRRDDVLDVFLSDDSEKIALDYVSGATGICRSYECAINELPDLLARIERESQSIADFAEGGLN
jgi:hypothetical protein